MSDNYKNLIVCPFQYYEYLKEKFPLKKVEPSMYLRNEKQFELFTKSGRHYHVDFNEDKWKFYGYDLAHYPFVIRRR